MENATLERHLTLGFDAALAKLPEALASQGFGVLTEIDIAATLKKKLGVDFRRYKILGACNPTLAHQALSAVLEVGVMLPCNVVVYEADDGHAVVHAIDPTRTIASAEPALAELAKTVRDKLSAALAQL
ncbi:MAG: DUF302 domain-containing protein [Myxococcales bacterium]|nr:DUF302 domain-containing protein [Myxococcales bacterium]